MNKQQQHRYYRPLYNIEQMSIMCYRRDPVLAKIGEEVVAIRAVQVIDGIIFVQCQSDGAWIAPDAIYQECKRGVA